MDIRVIRAIGVIRVVMVVCGVTRVIRVHLHRGCRVASVAVERDTRVARAFRDPQRNFRAIIPTPGVFKQNCQSAKHRVRARTTQKQKVVIADR